MNGTRCISYYSYIKPQLYAKSDEVWIVVYRTIPTSNHNRLSLDDDHPSVVYRTIPTSNHNRLSLRLSISLLYIVLFLHQTTTKWKRHRVIYKLYIVLFLHQTTTILIKTNITSKLYIVLFLHQTTTLSLSKRTRSCCISYYSYIKPQPARNALRCRSVVYRTIPTSNHNLSVTLLSKHQLYIVLFLHQTTT